MQVGFCPVYIDEGGQDDWGCDLGASDNILDKGRERLGVAVRFARFGRGWSAHGIVYSVDDTIDDMI
jgi:hypothetical protein